MKKYNLTLLIALGFIAQTGYGMGLPGDDGAAPPPPSTVTAAPPPEVPAPASVPGTQSFELYMRPVDIQHFNESLERFGELLKDQGLDFDTQRRITEKLRVNIGRVNPSGIHTCMETLSNDMNPTQKNELADFLANVFTEGSHEAQNIIPLFEGMTASQKVLFISNLKGLPEHTSISDVITSFNDISIYKGSDILSNGMNLDQKFQLKQFWIDIIKGRFGYKWHTRLIDNMNILCDRMSPAQKSELADFLANVLKNRSRNEFDISVEKLFFVVPGQPMTPNQIIHIANALAKEPKDRKIDKFYVHLRDLNVDKAQREFIISVLGALPETTSIFDFIIGLESLFQRMKKPQSAATLALSVQEKPVQENPAQQDLVIEGLQTCSHMLHYSALYIDIHNDKMPKQQTPKFYEQMMLPDLLFTIIHNKKYCADERAKALQFGLLLARGNRNQQLVIAALSQLETFLLDLDMNNLAKISETLEGYKKLIERYTIPNLVEDFKKKNAMFFQGTSDENVKTADVALLLYQELESISETLDSIEKTRALIPVILEKLETEMKKSKTERAAEKTERVEAAKAEAERAEAERVQAERATIAHITAIAAKAEAERVERAERAAIAERAAKNAIAEAERAEKAERAAIAAIAERAANAAIAEKAAIAQAKRVEEAKKAEKAKAERVAEAAIKESVKAARAAASAITKADEAEREAKEVARETRKNIKNLEPLAKQEAEAALKRTQAAREEAKKAKASRSKKLETRDWDKPKRKAREEHATTQRANNYPRAYLGRR